MADLGTEVDLSGDWTELTVPLGMTAGTNYVLDIVEANKKAVGYWAETDSATPEPTSTGQPWLPFSPIDGQSETRVYPNRSGVFFWVRLDRGTGKVKAHEAGI